MGKKDKLLKEAFLVYQSANTKHSESESSAMKDLPEYTEGFEDKIYRCIERMHITNPQEKAKKIKVAVFGLLILCCLGVFFFYKYKHKPVEATKQLEELFQEAYDWHYTHEDYIPERVYEEGSDLQYEVLLLNTELIVRLEEMKLPCRKTEKTMSAGYSDFCGTGAGGMNSMVWDVYELTDRKSHYYYILKNNVDQVAIARYASVYIGDDEPKERMGMDELMESVFGIVSEKDIRSVTLTRCRPVSEENPEVLMAMYTTPAEKQQILEVLSRNRVIYNVWEGVDEEQNALPEWYSVEKLKDGGWYDATSAMPENCYLMTIENRYREEMILGVVALEEEVRVFVDIDVKGIIQRKRVSDDLIICYEEKHCIGLLPEQQKQVSEWIRLAE